MGEIEKQSLIPTKYTNMYYLCTSLDTAVVVVIISIIKTICVYVFPFL